MQDIPDCATRVTAAWVAEALGAVDRLIAVEREPIGEGAGVFGEITRLRLRYEGAQPEDPTSLILKLPPRARANRTRSALFHLGQREVGFYRDIAPTIDLRVPRCYWSGLDGSGRSALLLEDLASLERVDQRTGLDPHRAGLAVESLAAVHAQYWDSPRLAALEWLPALDAPVMLQLADVYRETWPEFVRVMGAGIPSEATRIGERVGERLEGLLEGLAVSPATLCHGDFRADNLFFGDGIVAIDWQLVSRARGALDVAYLLSQSMTVEDRRRAGKATLRNWHAELVRRGVDGYSFEDAIADYGRAILVCLAYAVAGTDLDRTNARDRALAEAQAVRGFTAAADLEAESVLSI